MRVDGLAAAEANDAIGEAFGIVAEIHRLMSFHAADSELSRLNRQAWRAPVRVGVHTRAVLEKALDVAEASGGLFDPAVGGAIVRKGLAPAPDAGQPDSGASWPDSGASWKNISLGADGSVAFTRPLWIDLGGIAKGYAVDCAIAHLERYRPARICVEAGGDLRLAGAGVERIHLGAPGADACPAALDVEDAAVASSGSQAAADGGLIRPHVDPRTGASCRADRFVTVVARRCIDADALTKVVMAAGAAAAPVLARYGARAFLHEDAGWSSIAEAA